MKTNRIMDEIRSTITPEMKKQMELSFTGYPKDSSSDDYAFMAAEQS